MRRPSSPHVSLPALLMVLTLGCDGADTYDIVNRPPEVVLSQPAEGQRFKVGAPLTLKAVVDDDFTPPDQLAYLWTSSLQGTLSGVQTLNGQNALLTVADLDPGTHTLTVTVSDDKGTTGQDAVTIEVVENAPPQIVFLGPAPGSRHAQGAPVFIEALAADADAADLSTLALTWTGAAIAGPSTPGADGRVGFYLTDLRTGEIALEVKVADETGSSGRASLAFLVEPLDKDGDTFGDAALGGTDCDDLDPLIHPAAAERCDGLDNNCDGSADEGAALGSSPAYLDGDGDGYGQADRSVTACAPPPGYVRAPGDCDDFNPSVHPGASEVCTQAGSPIDEDCDGVADEGGALDAALYYKDGDHDGFGDPASPEAACRIPVGFVVDGSDCRPQDPHSFPGAPEHCDGLDNDCDHLTDEAGVDPRDYYPDQDRDGFGGPGTPTVACAPPAGFAEGSLDCDDANPAIYPDAPTRCDLGGAPVDDDCDGQADEATGTDAPAWCPDADGDGFGSSSEATRACAPPEGSVRTCTDCADDDPQVGPMARDLCADGKDNDCDGRTDNCPLLGARSLERAEGLYTGAVEGQGAGAGIAFIGDHDGGGHIALLADGPSGSGVYILPGAMGVLEMAGGEAHIPAPAESSFARAQLAAVGDLNDDGYGDLLLGLPDWAGGAGAAYLFYGPLRGEIPLARADGILHGAGVDALGASVDGLGDIDGDGRGDLLLGAPGARVEGEEAGIAWIVPGPVYGEHAVGAVAVGFLQGESPGDRAGASACGAGDVNGDGTPDLLIGAPGQDDGAPEGGGAYLVYGPIRGGQRLSAVGLELLGTRAGERAGGSCAGGGDLNGDGLMDAVVGAHGASFAGVQAGAAYVFFGPIKGHRALLEAEVIVYGERDYDYLGHAIALPGDLDGDGVGELLLGAPGQDRGAPEGGAVYLFYGPVAGVMDALNADATLLGEGWFDGAGSALAPGGDLNGDGFGDLLLGAPYARGTGVGYGVLGGYSTGW